MIFEGMLAALAEGVDPRMQRACSSTSSSAPTSRGQAKAQGLQLAMPVEKCGPGRVRLRVRRGLRRAHRGVRSDLHQGARALQPRGRRRDERAPGRAAEAAVATGCTTHDRRFLFELLVPAEPAQLETRGRRRRPLRPRGPARADAARRSRSCRRPASSPTSGRSRASTAARTARRSPSSAASGGRDEVACVVLGRGADDAAVDHWLRDRRAACPATSGSRSAARSGGTR